MYLLYLDESGNENDPSDRYFVLAGVALFERQTYFLSRGIDAVQQRYFPNHQPIQFHASEIRSGRKLWRKMDPATRDNLLADLASEICKIPDQGRYLFAAAIEKTGDLWGEAAVEKATEQVCQRFDILLQRQYRDHNNPQRGLIVFSEGRFDARAKIWVRGFHQRGTTWGTVNNLADIPYFASAKESRLLQAADFIAHAVWLMYEKRDVSLIRPIISKFDCHHGTLHGLVHITPSATGMCDCPACYSRANPGGFGPWI